jgi:hypothetical protein
VSHAQPDVSPGDRRARLTLEYIELGQRQHLTDEGFARITAGWIHWLGDHNDHWQSWPSHTVVCIEWIPATSPKLAT